MGNSEYQGIPVFIAKIAEKRKYLIYCIIADLQTQRVTMRYVVVSITESSSGIDVAVLCFNGTHLARFIKQFTYIFTSIF